MEQVDTPAEVHKYSAIASKLIGQIRNGEYRAGDLLPSEPELSRQFRVSHHTIRAALRSPYEKGLIVSQRGRGSIVQATSIEPRYSSACDSIEDVLLRAATTVMLRSFDSPFASRLQIRKGRTISDSIWVRRSCASSDASSTSAAAFSRVRAPCTRRKAFATR